MTPEILTAARPRRLPARCAELPYDDERPGRLDDPGGAAVPHELPVGTAHALGQRPATPRRVRTPGEPGADGAVIYSQGPDRSGMPGEPPADPWRIPSQRDGGRPTGPSPSDTASRAGSASTALTGKPRGLEGQRRRDHDSVARPEVGVPKSPRGTRTGAPPARPTAAIGAGSPAAGLRPGADGRFAPTPSSAAAVVVRAIVEALSGIRPATQLARWTTPRLQADLERRIPRETRHGRDRWVIRSIRVSQPRPGVAEVSAVIIRSTRAAAVALRMESADGRWRVTTLQVG
ncbi:MAG: Rv3235 family protein [Frankia sp.]